MGTGNSFTEVPVKVNEKLLEIVPQQVVRERIQYLVGLFKQDYEKLLTTQISDETTLLHLMHLSFSLDSLEECAGFHSHLMEFRNDIDSTYLVTTLASYLRPRTRELVLEPITESTGKRADIRIDLEGQHIFFECKNPKKEVLSRLRAEQEPMYEALKYSISRPCNVFITYETALKEAELVRLGGFLKERLPLVTGEGTILDHNGVRVDVTNVREAFQNIGNVQVQMILENYHSNERNPVNIINRDGIAIGFAKRRVSVINNIEQQFKASQKKVSREAPLILAIQSDYLTGSLDENVRAISSLFQPSKHTSFNGVLLVRWSYNFQNLIDPQFHYVNNPYARNPIADLARLFRSH